VVEDLWSGLAELQCKRSFTPGSPLFAEGDSPGCVYLIESGQVRLGISTDRGSTRLLATAGPGTLLGLGEAMGGEPHKVSATSIGKTETSYVRREELLEFLTNQPQLCMEIVRLLSEDLHSLYHQFRCLSSKPNVHARRRTADGRFH
jgi:CRP-like cAMP-binding protein